MKPQQRSRRYNTQGLAKQQDDSSKHLHPHLRRQTAVYRQKRSLVKDIWIGSGLIVIFMPLSVQLTLLLATVFLSFCILDETEDH